MKVVKIILKILLYMFLVYMLIMGIVIGTKYESSRVVGYILITIGFLSIIGFTILFTIKKPARMKKGYAKLELGMSIDEVISILGQPTGRKLSNGTQTLTWRISEFKGLARGGTKQRSIIAEFENDKLIGYDSDNMGMLVV